ncbi:MAG: flagellar biosynthesis protein FlhA [Caulobacterales bacterium]
MALVAGMVLILIVLFCPIPAIFLDFAILTNFGFGLTILLLTLYVAKPVEFSTFPSLLLISTLFRISLNVAATRLILTEADAGDVINSIGAFAVGGNYVVGLVVFFILVVVQYIVVTSGAQRVSEVAARFTLDSMPGQQMSIDADLNMGLIDQKEALRRRAALEKQASFYGAMDGASKFVKGDAVAGVIILLINIIAGLIIGVAQMGMDWGEALQHFTLLTIGDGIATQLPALIISIATGIIVTRSAADDDLSSELFKQLSSAPRILPIVAGILCLLLLLPGMPKWPIVFIVGLSIAYWLRLRRKSPSKGKRAQTEDAETADAASQSAHAAPLAVAAGKALGQSWSNSHVIIMERIASLRQAHERAFGMPFPAVQIIDGAELADFEYDIRLFGTRYGRGEIHPDQILAIRGDRATERLPGAEKPDPAFGLPSLWIESAQKEAAQNAGYTIVDPLTVFITHFGEVLRTEASALLTRSTTASLLEGVRSRQPGLVEELIPQLMTVSDVQRVLQNLLSEGVPISAIDLIAEHLVDLARTEKDISALTELLRQRMSVTICNKLRDRHSDLAVLSLDPRLENQIQTSVAQNGKRDSLAIDPRLAERLIRKLASLANEMMAAGREPVLLCGAEIRRQMRALTRRSIPKLSIVSVSEIPATIDLRSQGVVRVESDEPTSPHPPRAAEQQPPASDGFGFQLGYQRG